MPAQKRPLPAPSDHLGGSTDSPNLPPPLPSQQQHQLLPQADGEQPPQPNPPPELPKKQDGGKDDSLNLSPSLFFFPLRRLSISPPIRLVSSSFFCSCPDSDGEGGSQSSDDEADKDE